jgi:hypothetical protein
MAKEFFEPAGLSRSSKKSLSTYFEIARASSGPLLPTLIEKIEGQMQSENEVLARLWANFRGDLSERLNFVKVHIKGDLHGDMPDSLLWHFTRLSVFESIVRDRQIWLSNLTKSNDEDEIRFALRRVGDIVTEIAPNWKNRNHARKVAQLAKEVIAKLDSTALFGFCMSEERDLVHHWGAYGGGLRVRPDPKDPYVAIGFDAGAMAFPLELTTESAPVFLLNVIYGDESARALCRYWALKARATLELLDARTTGLSSAGANQLLKQSLLFSCALVKGEGWRGEEEFRLIYLPDFDKTPLGPPRARPDGRGTHLPLAWDKDKSPVRAVMPHPLATFDDVERRVRTLQKWKSGRVLRSELRPRL